MGESKAKEQQRSLQPSLKGDSTMKEHARSSTNHLTLNTPHTPAPPLKPAPNHNTEDAAKFLNVKPATLEQWRWNGRGPRFVKIGRSCRYRLQDLEAFLEERVYSSTTEAQAAVVA